MTFDFKAERHNRGLSLDALSEKTAIPKSTLARIERGVVPAVSTQFKLATYYGKTVTEIWPLEDVAA